MEKLVPQQCQRSTMEKLVLQQCQCSTVETQQQRRPRTRKFGQIIIHNPFFTPPPPPHPTRAIKSTKTPPISLEFVLRACGLYELSFTCLGALFLAIISCFSPDFVLLRPQPRRDRHPTFSRPSGTPPSFAREAHAFSAHHLRSATATSSAEI
jgi:hypothetical protein